MVDVNNHVSRVIAEARQSFQSTDRQALIERGPQATTIYAGGGNDHVNAHQNEDGSVDITVNGEKHHFSAHEAQSLIIDLGDGHDNFTASGSAIGANGYTVRGQAGNDIITGSDGPDHLQGGTGNDTIIARGGNDNVTGGDGNDTVFAGDGNDAVFGQNGNDRLLGGAGSDRLDGGFGADLVVGQDGVDEVSGGIEIETTNGQPSGITVNPLDDVFQGDVPTNTKGEDDSTESDGEPSTTQVK